MPFVDGKNAVSTIAAINGSNKGQSPRLHDG
jgi:hypothetical protein